MRPKQAQEPQNPENINQGIPEPEPEEMKQYELEQRQMIQEEAKRLEQREEAEQEEMTEAEKALLVTDAVKALLKAQDETLGRQQHPPPYNFEEKFQGFVNLNTSESQNDEGHKIMHSEANQSENQSNQPASRPQIQSSSLPLALSTSQSLLQNFAPAQNTSTQEGEDEEEKGDDQLDRLERSADHSTFINLAQQTKVISNVKKGKPGLIEGAKVEELEEQVHASHAQRTSMIPNPFDQRSHSLQLIINGHLIQSQQINYQLGSNPADIFDVSSSQRDSHIPEMTGDSEPREQVVGLQMNQLNSQVQGRSLEENLMQDQILNDNNNQRLDMKNIRMVSIDSHIKMSAQLLIMNFDQMAQDVLANPADAEISDIVIQDEGHQDGERANASRFSTSVLQNKRFSIIVDQSKIFKAKFKNAEVVEQNQQYHLELNRQQLDELRIAQEDQRIVQLNRLIELQEESSEDQKALEERKLKQREDELVIQRENTATLAKQADIISILIEKLKLKE